MRLIFSCLIRPSIKYYRFNNLALLRKMTEVPSPERSRSPVQRPAKKIKTKKYREPPVDPISPEGVLISDIKDLLTRNDIRQENVMNDMQAFFNRSVDAVPLQYGTTIQVTISGQSSVGDGLAVHRISDDRQCVVVVPYALIGEVVEAKVYKTFKYYFQTDLIRIVSPSSIRDDSLVKCRYFTKCSGCQYQMIPYSEQLKIKQQVIINAFKHYASNVNPSLIPDVLPTEGSPLQYNYRTKLTPHFDVPRSGKLDQPPDIGFGERGRKSVLDIEECSIGTEVLNKGLMKQREFVHKNFLTYKRGATLLLRENTMTIDDGTKQATCSTSSKDIISEYVGNFKFQFPASSFFQNNNSILPLVTSYVRENIVSPSTGEAPKYLVDTYCGSGLFAITCSQASESVIGVEISKESVSYAQKNAEMNEIKNASFILGQAEKIFEKVKTPPQHTSIIIDPPRKGCDNAFLDQLLEFKPSKIVYVSCNVHSQARDIEYLLTSDEGKKYKIDSIKGFDFFPQTHHVESVVVLRLT